MAYKKLIDLKELPELETVIQGSLKLFYLDDVIDCAKKFKIDVNNKIELFVLLVYMQSGSLIARGKKTINSDLICNLEKIAEHSKILASLIAGLPQYGVREWFEGFGQAESSKEGLNPAVEQCASWVLAAECLTAHFSKIQPGSNLNFADLIVCYWFNALDLSSNICDSYRDFAEGRWRRHSTQLKNVAAKIVAFSEQPDLKNNDDSEVVSNRARAIGNYFREAFPRRLEERLVPIESRLRYLGNNSIK